MIGAVDIGGTKLAVGLVNEGGQVLAKRQAATGPESAYSANARPIQWKYSDPSRRLHANEFTATVH